MAYVIVQKRAGTKRIAHHPECRYIGKRHRGAQPTMFLDPDVLVCSHCKGLPTTERNKGSFVDLRKKASPPRRKEDPKPVGEFYRDYSSQRNGRMTPTCCPSCGNTDLFWDNPSWSCYICSWFGKILPSRGWKRVEAPIHRRRQWGGETDREGTTDGAPQSGHVTISLRGTRLSA